MKQACISYEGRPLTMFVYIITVFLFVSYFRWVLERCYSRTGWKRTESVLGLAQSLLIGGVDDIDDTVRFCIVLKHDNNTLERDSIRIIRCSECVSPYPIKTAVLLVLRDPRTSDELSPDQWCRLNQKHEQ